MDKRRLNLKEAEKQFPFSFTLSEVKSNLVICKPKTSKLVYGGYGFMKMTVRQMTLIALNAAVISVLAPIAIPLAGQVPISLATLAVMISAAVFGKWTGAAASALYIVLGILGMPVFAGFSSGAAVAFGLSGGYIFGYIALAYFTGLFAEKAADQTGRELYALLIAGMVIGTVVLYAIGTVWFMKFTGMTLAASLGACVVPFIPGDCIKMAVVCLLYGRLKPLASKVLKEKR